MRIRIAGRIVDAEPRLPSRIAGKRLILDGKGREHMILDSGFTGSKRADRRVSHLSGYCSSRPGGGAL